MTLGDTSLGDSALGDEVSPETQRSAQQKRKSVAIFCPWSDTISSIAEFLGQLDVEVAWTGMPSPAPTKGVPPNDLAIVVIDESLAQIIGTTADAYGSARVAFVRSTAPVSSDLLALLNQAFPFVETFSTDERLRALVQAAVSEFLGDAISAFVAGASLADRAARKDSLGFAPYVEAVGEFLLNRDTKAPLTMSVEGSWGSGKSSFMLQLGDYLRTRNALAIDFNAWRHEKAEELWAAFAIQFVHALKRTPKSRLERLRREIALANSRFDWSRGGFDLVRVVLLIVAIAFLTVAVPVFVWTAGAQTVSNLLANSTGQRHLTGWMATLLAGGGGAAWLSAMIPLWRIVTKQLSNPLAIDLKKYVRAPDYETKVAFLDRFHEDLDRVIEAFVDEGQKVFVFIDDLDRCEVPHAADLMQAINLMLADHGPLIFIIGMDREKVAAGLAVKHEKLLPYLSLDTPTKERLLDGLQGLAFGYNFIEKFIQVPFVIPEPTDADIERLLTPGEEPTATPAVLSPLVPTVSDVSTSDGGTRPRSNPTPRAYVTLDLGADDPVVIDIAKMVAPSLDHNPRRIKQFINLFRLRALIADATGLFLAAESTPRSRRLTLHKLGKYVALELRWPLLLAQLEQQPSLLAELERAAIDNKWPNSEYSPRVTYWGAQPLLLNLLRSRCVTTTGERDDSGIAECSLARIDLLLLLRVAPAIKKRVIDTTDNTPAPYSTDKASMPEIHIQVPFEGDEFREKSKSPSRRSYPWYRRSSEGDDDDDDDNDQDQDGGEEEGVPTK